MKVAIVHDWLTEPGGAEKVLSHLLDLYPQADLYSLVDFFPDDERARLLGGRRARTTFIQRMPRARRSYRSYLPFMPIAIEQLDLSSYELVISSSYAVAKGVITGPDQVHVSYVHSPIRYAWDLQHQYLRDSGMERGFKSILARAILHYIRMWDVRTAFGVDSFAVNSAFIAKRVRKVYGREATVIYPPVDVDKFTVGEKKDDFYVTASRMVPYKKIGLIVQAFSKMPDKKLKVIGAGPEWENIKKLAGPNVEMLGYQSFEVLSDLMRRARAFVFAAEEDFGIAPVEAQACGTPVIAYGKGGTLESVISGSESRRTGLHFPQQTAEAICEAVERFETIAHTIDPWVCRANAERFSPRAFKESFSRLVRASMGD